MDLTHPICLNPYDHVRSAQPDLPVLYFCPSALRATARRFLDTFPGVVSYAIKCNDRAEVLAGIAAEGVNVFDVASPPEMRAVRAWRRTRFCITTTPSARALRLPRPCALACAPTRWIPPPSWTS